MNGDKEIIKVARVKISAAVSEVKPRYWDKYVGNQKTTVVRITPVMMEIRVNLII